MVALLTVAAICLFVAWCMDRHELIDWKYKFEDADERCIDLSQSISKLRRECCDEENRKIAAEFKLKQIDDILHPVKKYPVFVHGNDNGVIGYDAATSTSNSTPNITSDDVLKAMKEVESKHQQPVLDKFKAEMRKKALREQIWRDGMTSAYMAWINASCRVPFIGPYWYPSI